MKHVVVPGVVLGVLVGAWTFVMGFTGWYKHPTLNALFFAVVVIEIGVLIWALRASAKDGGTYGRQVGRGLMISVVGGLIIIASSLLFTLVAFPRYFEELKALQVELKLPEQPAAMQTPVAQALAGFIGTVVTGLVASLLIALVARKK